MQMRRARFDDIPALVDFDGTLTRREWQQILHDPWVTVTIAETEEGMCGWITYTVQELRQLVLRSDLWTTQAAAELYSEGYGHWRTAATERARAWVVNGEPATDYLTDRGWRPTGRKRRDPSRPVRFLTEVMLEFPSPD